ncbi:porin family protein [Hymenobacter psychrophilus]|uniref:Outer membrane protein beta-barrel domain-containing protein n=1 Tax=Hymenobacter psychrophilus TaxID=651662 RepID=A0A1H3NNB8_9BACT|nr:porin family protein [Hymenobacter psychrophilus]SDY90243.1 Outer membrane protein beta-barrel domain-containing protein [Hymenobacter psychrophilus]
MKKLFLVLLASAGITSAAHAQGARLGVKAGASLTNFVGEDADGVTNKIGVHGGFVAELGITDNFAIQPEVLFSMKGAKVEDLDNVRINQSYIDVPVLLKVKADGLFFEAGPQVGLLIGSKTKDDDISFNSKDGFKTVDFGYVAGLGYEFSSGPMIGLRYNGGITKVAKEEDGANSSDMPNVRNSAFQLYVGFMFGGK